MAKIRDESKSSAKKELHIEISGMKGSESEEDTEKESDHTDSVKELLAALKYKAHRSSALERKIIVKSIRLSHSAPQI